MDIQNCSYDSSIDTYKHKSRVLYYMNKIISSIMSRAEEHDNSKLVEPEKTIFDNSHYRLKEIEYGSEQYKESLNDIKVALNHHYSVNRHHPEHFENGIKDMDIIDIIEMLCDWKAASEKCKNGDILKSIDINQERFGYGDEIKQLFINTITNLK